MSREIKFRARISGTDIWLDDFGFHFTAPSMVFLSESQLEKLNEDVAEKHGEFYDNIVYFHVDVIVQFTGLLDKNGVEIYEGDILKVTDEEDELYYLDNKGQEHPRVDTGIAAVEFYDGLWYVSESVNNGLYELHQIGQKLEVIGNIYESPELLK